MALSETMSNSTDWMNFYQHNLSQNTPTPPNFNGSVSDSVTVAAAAESGAAQSNSSSTYSNSNMESGRVSRPLRRRSRASRRTPVTLLNTDTSNFRAMVQQFTGGPSSSFASRPEYSSGINFGFGIGTQQTMNPSAAMVPQSGFQVQFQRRQQYSNQQQQMFSSMNNNIHGDAAAFLHKFGPNMEAGASGGYVNNTPSSHMPPPEASGGSGGRNGFLQ